MNLAAPLKKPTTKLPYIDGVSPWGLCAAFVIIAIASFLAYALALQPQTLELIAGRAGGGAAPVPTGLMVMVATAVSGALLPFVAYSAAVLKWVLQRQGRKAPEYAESSPGLLPKSGDGTRQGLNVDIAIPHLLAILTDAQTRPLRLARRRRDIYVHIAVALIICLLGTIAMIFLARNQRWLWLIPYIYLSLTSAIALMQSRFEQKAVRRMEELLIDLHRFELYEALRWPLPASPEEELRLGVKLSNSLAKGFVGLGNFEYLHDAKLPNVDRLLETVKSAFDSPAFSRFEGVMSVGASRIKTPSNERSSKSIWMVEVELGPKAVPELSTHEAVHIPGELRSEVEFTLRLDSDYLRVPERDKGLQISQGASGRVRFDNLTVQSDDQGTEPAVWVSLLQQGEVMQVAKVVLEDADR